MQPTHINSTQLEILADQEYLVSEHIGLTRGMNFTDL